MAIVNNVLLALHQIFPDNRAETRHEEDPLAGDLVHEQTFAGEHGFGDGLGFVLLGHAGRAADEGVFADGPFLVAGEAEEGDVANGGRGEEELAGAGEGRVRHFAADEEFFEGEFDGAAEGDGGGHGDHYAWSGGRG